MRQYPVRHGRSVPGAETADDYTLEGARNISRNCPKCYGCGFAPIFSPQYQGKTIQLVIDDHEGIKHILMRSTVFCICPAGRKIAVLNQQSNDKEFFSRTPDLHDVIAGHHREWIADDPTYNPAEEISVRAVPEQLRRLAGTLKVYQQLEEAI